MIVPNPTEITGARVENNEPPHQEWLAIKHDWSDEGFYHDLTSRTQEAVRALREPSQTCRSLRAFCLPKLWKFVLFSAWRNLGNFARRSDLARVVHCFCFLWTMKDDYFNISYDDYPSSEGTLLDIAFKDRWQMFTNRAEELGYEIQWDQLGEGFEGMLSVPLKLTLPDCRSVTVLGGAVLQYDTLSHIRVETLSSELDRECEFRLF